MTESIKEKREARRRRRKNKVEEEAPVEVEAADKGITEAKGRATPSRRKGEVTQTKKESRNPIVRSFAGVREYFEGVQSEIQKVTWPTREEAQRLTWIVGAVTLASSLFLGGLSILFTELFNIGVNMPWVFILVFVAFIGLMFAYARFVNQSSSDY